MFGCVCISACFCCPSCCASIADFIRWDFAQVVRQRESTPFIGCRSDVWLTRVVAAARAGAWCIQLHVRSLCPAGWQAGKERRFRKSSLYKKIDKSSKHLLVLSSGEASDQCSSITQSASAMAEVLVPEADRGCGVQSSSGLKFPNPSWEIHFVHHRFCEFFF